MLISEFIGRTLNRILSHIAMRRIFICILLIGLGFLIFTIIAHVIDVDTPGFANWRGLLAVTRKSMLEYFAEWSGPLGIIAMLFLAFAAFWVISDTRHFKYLDDKTKTIADLNNWTAGVFRQASILSRYFADTKELKKSLIDCRIELMIKVAQSIGVFAAALQLSTDVRIKRGEELKETIGRVDHELRTFITMLFDIDIEKATVKQIDQLVDGAVNLSAKIRELLEIASQI